MPGEYLLDLFNLLAQSGLAHEGKEPATVRHTGMVCRASWPDHSRYAHPALWVLGGVALGVLSFTCFLLGIDLTTSALALLAVILVLSLLAIAGLVRRQHRLEREDVLRRRQVAYLAEAQKLSHTGSFVWNVASGELFWSEETFRIFDLEPTLPPSLDTILKRTHPDDLNAVREALDRAANDRNDFSLEHRLILNNGSIRHIRVVARGTSEDR